MASFVYQLLHTSPFPDLWFNPCRDTDWAYSAYGYFVLATKFTHRSKAGAAYKLTIGIVGVKMMPKCNQEKCDAGFDVEEHS